MASFVPEEMDGIMNPMFRVLDALLLSNNAYVVIMSVFFTHSRLTDRDVCTSSHCCNTLHLTKLSVKDHHSLEPIFYSASWFLYEP